MAYVLGFLVADGSVTDADASSRTQYIEFTNTDKKIIEKIRDALQSKHPLQFRKPRVTKYPDGAFHKSSPIFRLRIGSKELFADILKLGVIPRKSNVITFPKIPPKHLSHFVRGYFDGDGCIYIEYRKRGDEEAPKRMRTIFTSGSQQYLEGLREELSMVTDMGKGNMYYEHRAFRLVYDTNESRKLFRFMYRGKRDLFLKRKYNIFKSYKISRQRTRKTVKSN